ncbi:hypothetical protein DFP78_11385 [Photobacterium lutimaris]|nr:hypothetical protein DFP78_11385 [Photobacterium lutimaris]
MTTFIAHANVATSILMGFIIGIIFGAIATAVYIKRRKQ